MLMYFTTLFIVFHSIYVVIINMITPELPEFLPETEALDTNGLRTKSSLRMHYDAQTIVIERQLEGLEGVRAKLGLTQRKMAQLLLIDPSAWTRWNRPGHRAPGVVWRALQWYMILQEKIPGLTPNYFLASAPSVVRAETLKDLKKESEARELLEKRLTNLDRQLSQFEIENKNLYQRLLGLETKLKIWRIGTLILTLTLLFSSFIWVFLRNRL